MIRDKKNIVDFSLIIFLLLSIIFNQLITRYMIAIVLLMYMMLCKKIYKNDKVESIYKRYIEILMGSFGVIYISTLYILGIFFGYYKSTILLSAWSILNYIIPYIVIIISAEIIRKLIILKENRRYNILIFIAMILLDIILSIDINNLMNFEDYIILIGFIIFASVANNLLYNYMIKTYRSNRGIILYRLITNLYMYIIPITPDIYVFFESIIRIIVPYIIWLILEKIYGKNKNTKSVKSKRKEILFGIISISLTIIFVMLISCKFTYGLLVIGSESMTGTIDKGDIIIYKSYENKDEIEENDIIVFNKNGLRIVHRVIEEKETASGRKYYTQGDANLQRDEGYRENNDIIGIVKMRIPYLGYFTVWINELIE